MAILKINFIVADFEQLSLSAFLNEILQSDSVSIIEHLTQYHSQSGDTCHIDNFTVTESSFYQGQMTGTVILSYLVNYVYACADITRQAKDHETWRFDIDMDQHMLTLHMPEYEVRSTADEF